VKIIIKKIYNNMFSKKTLIILSVVVLAVIGLAIAILLMDSSFFNEPETIDFTQSLEPETSSSEIVTEPEVIINLTPAEISVTIVARDFAERFASFSADSGFTNLEEVKLLSTASLDMRLNDMIEEIGESNEFYGISSKALKTDIQYLDEDTGNSRVVVTLQRQETNHEVNDVIYQDLNLLLVKSGNNWLVNDFKWLE